MTVVKPSDQENVLLSSNIDLNMVPRVPFDYLLIYTFVAKKSSVHWLWIDNHEGGDQK